MKPARAPVQPAGVVAVAAVDADRATVARVKAMTTIALHVKSRVESASPVPSSASAPHAKSRRTSRR